MTLSYKSLRRAALRALLVVPIFIAGESCTNLTEVPHDALTPENAFHTEPEILAGVAGVYAQFRSVEWVGYITINELTTDAMIVPTRGQDWYDNGQWLDLHRQDWTANSAGTLAFLNGAWSDLFSGVAKANLMIDVVSKAGGTKADSTVAELRSLRAWYYYMLQDLFGGVPLVTGTELKQYPRSTRREVFDFIETELLQSRDLLPDKWDAANYGRMTKGADNAILASLYLNAGVFTKDQGINATSYNSCSGVQVSGGTDACQAAIDAADAVINSDQYELATNWTDNFSPTNKSSPENIFVIVHTDAGTQGLGGSWPMRTLHYNQLSTGGGSPWNGFATLAETYAKFSDNDDRKAMWLEGQAYSFDNGQPVTIRGSSTPLVFTPSIANVDAATEAEGVRFNKFPPIRNAATGNSFPNDFPFFRLAEMYLIKAEAENELGQTANALADLNVIHNRHDSADPITAATQQQIRDAILNERLLELTAEGKRRTDLVRNGHFLDQWSTTTGMKGDKRQDVHRVLFPIPSLQIQSNPLLQQNPGY